MCWLASQGATVAVPIGHSPDYDVIADFGDQIIPMAALEGTSGLTLGGPKYAEFEVEPGEPLPARIKAGIAAQS